MPLPKGILHNASQTVSPPVPAPFPPATSATTATPDTPPTTDARIHASLPAPPLPPATTQPTAEAALTRTNDKPPARRLQQKKRVHYTIEADLIAWAEDAYHDYRRADGSHVRSASEYIAELLRAARAHHRTRP